MAVNVFGPPGKRKGVPMAGSAVLAAYALVVLDSLELPWLAMAGRFEDCEQRMADIVRLDQEMALGQTEDATAGALMSLRLWQGRSLEVAPILEQFALEYYALALAIPPLVIVAWTQAVAVTAWTVYFLVSGHPFTSPRSAWPPSRCRRRLPRRS